MARLKKDKKAAASSTDLHKFFGLAPHPKASKSAPEIIVISDDEEDLPKTKLKRTLEGDQRSVNKRTRVRSLPAEDNFASRSTLTKDSSSQVIITLDGDDDCGTRNANGDTAFPVGDDWEMGDDESGAQEDSVDASESETLGSTSPGTSGKLNTCPVCGKGFLKQLVSELQEHINECLDRSVAQASSSRSHVNRLPSLNRATTSKPLRTLTSLPSPHAIGKNNAFSVLMSSTKENEAWREAETAEKSTFKGNKGRRKAPFYKVLQGMPIAVDAFRYGKIPGIAAYFLTHAHSDHYTNLSASWKNGPIYCSQGTANLIIHKLSVDPQWVHPLPMDVPTIIPDTGGVHVTLIEANHCPGSCLFLYEGRQTINAGDSTFQSAYVGSTKEFRYLHCGDFRASPRHILHPAVKGKRIDHVYLDTTYLDPKYCFPPQPQVIAACAELAKRIVCGVDTRNGSDLDSPGKQKTMDTIFSKVEDPAIGVRPEKKMLVVIGTYSVGKERIVSAVAKSLDTKIYCDERKAAIIRCQLDPDLESMLTMDPLEAGVHIVPLSLISPEKLKIYAETWKNTFNRVIGFRPTGWTHTSPPGMNTNPSIPSMISREQKQTFAWSQLKQMKNSSQNLQVYAVPYSEHSSFFELTCFALSFDWGKMIATVNVESEKSRAKMSKWFERWEAERRKSKQGIITHRSPDYW